MSQYQKSADKMVLEELKKQQEHEADLLKKSKDLANQLRPQTSIDDLVHQAEDSQVKEASSSKEGTENKKTSEAVATPEVVDSTKAH